MVNLKLPPRLIPLRTNRAVLEKRRWVNWNPLYLNKEAQALVELAIFGSLLIMLLGILVNYGLRYNFQQQAMQQAFRKALGIAAKPNEGSATYLLLKDRHIPDPSHPFAIGSVIPVSASASVVRNYKMQETADTVEELPKININIQGQIFSFKTAGFRDEQNIPEDSLDKYKEIYGSNNVWTTADGIRIIDSGEGEIVNYDTAVRQCRQIVDEEACKKECERAKFPSSQTDCGSVCSKEMNVPWYCANYTEIDPLNHRYTFPVLDQLFGFAIAYTKPKSMGLQADYTKETIMDNALRKQEETTSITTKDTWDWQDKTKRKIIYKPYGDTSGSTTQQEVSSVVSQQKTEERKTPW